MLVLYKVDLIILSLKFNLFSPWYNWKIAGLALNNNHPLTINMKQAYIEFALKNSCVCVDNIALSFSTPFRKGFGRIHDITKFVIEFMNI